MSDMFCQNKKCPDKKNQNQIRGVKNNKHYQSNKVNSYYHNIACSLGCLNSWLKINRETLINSVGKLDKQTIKVEDSLLS